MNDKFPDDPYIATALSALLLRADITDRFCIALYETEDAASFLEEQAKEAGLRVERIPPNHQGCLTVDSSPKVLLVQRHQFMFKGGALQGFTAMVSNLIINWDGATEEFAYLLTSTYKPTSDEASFYADFMHRVPYRVIGQRQRLITGFGDSRGSALRMNSRSTSR